MTTTTFTTPTMVKIPTLIKDTSQMNNSQFNPHSMLHKTFNFPQKSQQNKYLDYTFISHKSKLNETEEKHKALLKAKEYLYDLINTWKLNLELVKTMSNNDALNELIVSIERKYKEKHDKIAIVKAKKSKLLIESQIQEEYKRKIRESEQYYKDQIDAAQDNVFNKEEYIKIFLKKLKEVEVFIQKHTKGLNNNDYAKYNVWKIVEFLQENTSLIHRRKDLYVDLDQIRHQILEIQQENYFYKEETIALNKKETSTEVQQKKKEINKYIENYRKRCHVLHTRTKLLKMTLGKMTNVKDLNIIPDLYQGTYLQNSTNHLNNIHTTNNNNYNDDEIKKSNTQNNQNGNNANNGSTMIIDKSIEISKKLESIMDFSLAMNKKSSNESKIDESNYKNVNFNNITYAWNLSCIQKKE